MEQTTFTIDGDYSQKTEVGHWVISHHTGHVHASRKIAGQNLTEHLGPITLTESVSGGAASLSASLALPFGVLPLGHFDLTKTGTYPIKAELDHGNWFKGTLTVSA